MLLTLSIHISIHRYEIIYIFQLMYAEYYMEIKYNAFSTVTFSYKIGYFL